MFQTIKKPSILLLGFSVKSFSLLRQNDSSPALVQGCSCGSSDKFKHF
jgi:hypothetical protein